MPPRYAYWTIIAGGLPTAFRAADREELLPTFHRLKEKHPDAEMKWFARGKLWDSPEQARPPRRDDFHRDGGDRARAGRDDRDRRGGPRAREPRAEQRGRDWRPGGEHRDPRQPFKDAKRARNQRERAARFEHKQRFGEKQGDRRVAPPAPPDASRRTPPPREKPHGDTLRGKGRPEFRPPRGDRQERPQQTRQFDDRTRAPGPTGTGWKDRPPREKPHGDAPRGKGRPEFRPPRGDRQERPQQTGRFDDRTRTAPGPAGTGWKDRPPREKPHGDALRAKSRWNEPPRQNEQAKRRSPPRAFDSRKPSGPAGSDRLPRPPREKPHGDTLRKPASRDFAAGRRFERNQGTEEPKAPPPPVSPTREPRPNENPEPSAPPHPSEPAIPPPGPPERGRSHANPRRDRSRR